MRNAYTAEDGRVTTFALPDDQLKAAAADDVGGVTLYKNSPSTPS